MAQPMLKHVVLTVFCIAISLLQGCGGGGGDGLPDVAAARVSLGENRLTNEQQIVTITAVADPLGGNYAWTISGSSGSADVEDFVANGTTATFTAPQGTGTQVYQVSVKYTSPENKVATDSVEITVAPVNTPPFAQPVLSSPAADAIAPGSTVVLSASQSSDVDGSIESFSWRQISGAPAVTVVGSSNLETFQFVAPEVSSKTSFIFRVTVTDNEQGTDDGEVTIVVDPDIITHQVLAGPDMTVNEEQQVALSANAIPVGGTFFWTTSSGNLAEFFPSTNQTVTFKAPLTTVPVEHTFIVEYQAPDGLILTDEVTVKVLPVNRLPVAAITVTSPSVLPASPGDIVTLNPQSSYDPDGNGTIVEYNWQALGNAPAYTVTSNNELVFTAPASVNAASYVFQLEVIDNEGGSRVITQEISVSGTDELNVANAGLDQTVKEFSTVTVDGSGSIIISGSSLSCSWRQIPTSAPTVVLTNANSCQATFTAPPVDVATSVLMELTVNGPANDTMIVNILPLSLGTLNDTGMTKCYGASAEITCDNVNFPRQDADYGRDAYPGQIDKAGYSFNNSTDSFDFTKLDENGDEMPITGSAAACIRDNVTGLIWEVKQGTAGTLRANTNTYTWSYPDGSTGGNEGAEGAPGGTCPSTEDCGLETFVEEVNASVYCGAANWRVPTMIELQSLINYSQGSSVGVIDRWAFNDIPLSGSPANLYYWTSETSAEGGGSASSWVLDFINGNDSILPKSSTTSAYVRLVRTP